MQMYTHYLSFYSAKSLCTGKTFDLSFRRINGYGQKRCGRGQNHYEVKICTNQKKIWQHV